MKSLEALREGYILFCVNGRYYLRYGAARRQKDFLTKLNVDIVFEGLHWGRRRWEGFYYAHQISIGYSGFLSPIISGRKDEIEGESA
jgi:hypothetical protein